MKKSTTSTGSEISRTAISHNHNLSIMGSGKHNTYTANLTYNDYQRTIIGTGRTNIRARAMVSQYLFDDKLKLSAEIVKPTGTSRMTATSGTPSKRARPSRKAMRACPPTRACPSLSVCSAV